MKGKYFIYGVVGMLLIISVYFVFSGCGNVPMLVGNEEFSEFVDEGVFTLQVHAPYYGEIEGTDLVIEDWENIEKYLSQLPGKDEKIAAYCQSGRMSGIVAKKLADLGYKNVYDLDGGVNSWEASGRGLVVKER